VPVNAAHERYLGLLLEHAGGERYPSHRVLERIESALTDRRSAERYADLLLSAAERQRYPSLRMIDRAARVVTKMAVADKLQQLRSDDRG
jgi:hypothetical protein